MTGYDRKELVLSHDAPGPVTIRIEVDITGDGRWLLERSLAVDPGEPARILLPDALDACWIRFVSDRACRASAILTYE
jgi:hypothetical protein